MAFAVIIKINQPSVTQTHVGIVGKHWQGAKCPSGFSFLAGRRKGAVLGMKTCSLKNKQNKKYDLPFIHLNSYGFTGAIKIHRMEQMNRIC